MPRSNKYFKKHKKEFRGTRKQVVSAETCGTVNTPSDGESRPRPIPRSSEPSTVSSSKKKVSEYLSEYQEFENNENCVTDLINLKDLELLLSQISVCSKCHGKLSITTGTRLGLSVVISIVCNSCGFSVVGNNSKRLNGPNGKFEVNVRLAYAFRCIGKGEAAAKTLCGVMNMPSPPLFRYYTPMLGLAAKDVCIDSMKQAVEECVKENDNNRDITAIFDGSWQRRGHVSLNGIVSAIGANTGKVLDARILTKFCRCKKRLEKQHDTNCVANYAGTSGGMEVQGILDMFRSSEASYNIRYQNFLGDGDSSSYPTVAAAKPYGEDFVVNKLECVGHIQKRMGTRLLTLKSKLAKTKLADGKTIGGRGRLTHSAIKEIQNYYGLAIRRNVNSLHQMRQAIWAEFFHLSSSNETPQHVCCPKGPDSWCKFQRAKEQNELYDHDAHTHFPSIVMDEIRHIFKDLSHPQLLRKCLHGGTQNPCESLNSVVWSRIPKSNFVMRSTLEFGVYEAIACFNNGNITKCRVLKKLGINPGPNCISAMKCKDEKRISEAEKAIQEIQQKCRQKQNLAKRRMEDTYEEEEGPDNPSYGAGRY